MLFLLYAPHRCPRKQSLRNFIEFVLQVTGIDCWAGVRLTDIQKVKNDRGTAYGIFVAAWRFWLELH